MKKKPAKRADKPTRLVRFKASPEDWAAARARFERGPADVDFTAIAKQLGVSKQRVQQVATAGVWRKRADMDAINAMAQVKADAIQRGMVADGSWVRRGGHVEVDRGVVALPADVAPEVPAAPVLSAGAAPPLDSLTDPATAQEVRVQDQASSDRAEVLTRHRLVWPTLVVKVLNATHSSKQDWAAVKGLKAAIEAVAVAQKAERLAYGMDVPAEAPGFGSGRMTVILERETVPHGTP